MPYIKGDLYNELLCATLANQAPEPNPDPSPKDLPRTWDELAPGHLVIARETLEVGWWEVVVVERNGDLVTVRFPRAVAQPDQGFGQLALNCRLCSRLLSF